MSLILERRILRLYNNTLTKEVFEPITTNIIGTVHLTKRDNVELQVALVDTYAITPLSADYFPASGTEVDISGCTFKIGVKTILSYQNEANYTLISQTDNPSSDWQNLTSGRLSMLLLPDLLAGDYKMELEITTATGKKITVFLLNLTVDQDLNVGDEGTPTPSSPTYYTAAEVDALLDDVSSLAGIYVIQYPFPLQTLTMDDGLYFERDATAFKLSGFVQVAPQGQNIQMQLLKNGIGVGDLLEIRPGEQTGEIDIDDVDFLTTDALGAQIVQVGNDPYPGQNVRFRVHYKRTT